MRNALVAATMLLLVPIAAGCVTKGKYMQAIDTGNKLDARAKALDAENARLKADLEAAGKLNETLTANRSELERTLAAKSGELGKTITDLRHRVAALEDDKAKLTRDLAEEQKAREDREAKVKEVSSTYEQL